MYLSVRERNRGNGSKDEWRNNNKNKLNTSENRGYVLISAVECTARKACIKKFLPSGVLGRNVCFIYIH